MYITEKIDNYLDESNKKLTIEFFTKEFELSHGKKPSGTGVWAFEVEPKELADLLKKHKDVSSISGNTVFIKGSMTLNNAKKIMKNAIIDVYLDDVPVQNVYVEVAP